MIGINQPLTPGPAPAMLRRDGFPRISPPSGCRGLDAEALRRGLCSTTRAISSCWTTQFRALPLIRAARAGAALLKRVQFASRVICPRFQEGVELGHIGVCANLKSRDFFVIGADRVVIAVRLPTEAAGRTGFGVDAGRLRRKGWFRRTGCGIGGHRGDASCRGRSCSVQGAGDKERERHPTRRSGRPMAPPRSHAAFRIRQCSTRSMQVSASTIST